MTTPIPRYHVPAGNFHISIKRSLILQAFLGTCVGVALHCKSSGMGGIIHLLLPEPLATLTCTQPKKYATTGLPLFIESLQTAGARRESLCASIAGGALVGPLSQQDLDLDIGGRITEAVQHILAQEKINIIQSETGGFFTCCLNLDMRTGQTVIEPAGFDKLHAQPNLHTPREEEIITAMQQLKPIPQVALKILRLIDENSYDVDAIANEIRQDQVITARMLQLANSAMFGAKKTISSLDHAVVFLGQELLVRIVLSAAIQGYYAQTAMGYALCKGGIYYHALGCAQIAELLARKTGLESPARAYTAGLLHDIGKVVLDQYVTTAYPLFYREIIHSKENILTIEKRLLGMNHTHVGTLLAQQWSFPPALQEAIQHHHQPNHKSPHGILCAIVYLADVLISHFHSGLEIERLETKALSKNLDFLGLAPKNFAELVDLIPATIFKPLH